LINFATKLKETLLKNLFMMENNKELKRYKIATYSLSVACLILIGIIVFSSLKVQTIVVEKDKAQLLSTELQSELDFWLLIMKELNKNMEPLHQN